MSPYPQQSKSINRTNTQASGPVENDVATPVYRLRHKALGLADNTNFARASIGSERLNLQDTGLGIALSEELEEKIHLVEQWPPSRLIGR